jgi:hypothetical protein
MGPEAPSVEDDFQDLADTWNRFRTNLILVFMRDFKPLHLQQFVHGRVEELMQLENNNMPLPQGTFAAEIVEVWQNDLDYWCRRVANISCGGFITLLSKSTFSLRHILKMFRQQVALHHKSVPGGHVTSSFLALRRVWREEEEERGLIVDLRNQTAYEFQQ